VPGTGKGARIALVVAVAQNGVIGRQGGLAWRLPSDLKFFRQVTMNKPLIMGRKTFESIGKPLYGRDNIVITRNSAFEAPGILVAANLDDALELAQEKALIRGADEISIIGGAQIYALALPRADRIYLTRVHASPDGDTFFPQIDKAQWREISSQRHAAGPGDSADYSFILFERES
jgi:dihydrofolate reductase